MSDFITDRTLERLRLGELSDEESARVMEQLEATGQLARLEALIADDEAFLNNQPPEMLAARVRDTVRRRERSANREEERHMIDVQRGPIALAALALLIAGGIAALALSNRTMSPATVGSPATEPVSASPAHPTSEPAPQPTPPAPEAQRLVVEVADRDVRYPLPETLYLSTGQITTLGAKGIARVTIALNPVVSATAGEDVLYMEGGEPGNTIVKFFGAKRDGVAPSASTLAVVGEPIDSGELSALAASEPTLLSCAKHAPGYSGAARLTIVAAQGGPRVGNAYYPGLEGTQEAQLRACVEGIVENWALRPIPLSVGRLKFDFGAGAVCQPGEDC